MLLRQQKIQKKTHLDKKMYINKLGHNKFFVSVVE